MSSTDTELLLVSIAAMLSPTTLMFSVLALVLGDRPLRTGSLFFLGAFGAMLAIGVVAAFVLGNEAASQGGSTTKTWVAVFDVVAGVLLLVLALRISRRPRDPKRVASMIAQMSKIASSPAIAVVGAGATLANAGAFIPIALKDISQENPSASQFVVYWLLFSLISLLPLAIALVMLLVAHDWTERVLQGARDWLERNARIVAIGIVVLLAATLIRNGIAALT